MSIFPKNIPEILTISGLSVELIRKPIKHLYLRISPQGSIQISAPLKSSQTTLENFVNAKHTWITTHQERILARNQEQILPLAAQDKSIQEWHRRELKAKIQSLIEHYEPLMQVKVLEFGVKKMKTRWGTCQPRAKRIWLNLELGQKPDEYLEYVVVHEMVHLLEPSHNSRFKALMSQFMPDWQRRKKELNNGQFCS